MDKYIFVICIVFFVGLSFISCQKHTVDESGFTQFIEDYEAKVYPLNTRHSQAQWDAYITGKEEFFNLATQTSLQIDSIHQNKEDYTYLKSLKEEGVIEDPMLARQLEIIYNNYLAGQIDPQLNKQITERASEVEGVFANFRTEVDGKTYSDNEVTQILKTSKDSGLRETLWRAQKAIGLEVAEDIVELAKLRNQAAAQLGFKNYFEMALKKSELNPEEVTLIFDELHSLTEKPFKEVHGEIESVFSKRYGVNKEQLRPWHYEDLFAQGAPAIYAVNLDDYYKEVDIPGVASEFYRSINMPVEDILARSDLYEKEGKSQHAFSFWIDNKDDIRILCNIVPNERWMSTTLHELGHASYDKYIDRDLPLMLRAPAHPFTTEGIAMLMDRFASNAVWMDRALEMSPGELRMVQTVTKKNDRLSKLIFARWSMVMFNFEKEFYADPDQNLNDLWWDLVEKYQLVKRPDEPVGAEWATKFHIAAYPVYYQNYQLGELFASQVLSYVAATFYADQPLEQAVFWDNEQAGDFLKKNIFAPGKKYPWNEMIDKATGEKLTASHFVKIYVES